MTTKTTQQLARELADLLQARDNVSEVQDALWDAGIKLPLEIYPKIKDAIRSEIDKEAASIKKQLQEALASE